MFIVHIFMYLLKYLQWDFPLAPALYGSPYSHSQLTPARSDLRLSSLLCDSIRDEPEKEVRSGPL